MLFIIIIMMSHRICKVSSSVLSEVSDLQVYPSLLWHGWLRHRKSIRPVKVFPQQIQTIPISLLLAAGITCSHCGKMGRLNKN